MTAILCRWLNDELSLAVHVAEDTFARDFSDGYLFGEILARHQQQSDFPTFARSATSEAKLANFMKLEPTFRRLKVPFNSNMAQDIMNNKAGVANRVAYQLFVALNKYRQGGTTFNDLVPSAATQTAHRQQQQDHFTRMMKSHTPRQADIDARKLEQRFKERQAEQEERVAKLHREKEARAEEVRKQKHAAALERNRQIRADYNAKVQGWMSKPAGADGFKRETQKAQRPTRQAQESAGRARSLASSQRIDDFEKAVDAKAATTGATRAGGSSNVFAERAAADPADLAYVEQIRARRAEEEEGRREREKRRRRLVVRDMQAQKSAQQKQRQETLLAKLRRRSQQERRLATQLRQVRNEKEVIRQNRLYRQAQASERRRCDFEAALEREAELLRANREANRAKIAGTRALVEGKYAQRRVAAAGERREVCESTVRGLVDVALTVIQHREMTDKDVPPDLLRQWNELFVRGLPLTAAGATAAAGTVPQRPSEVLDELQFLDYHELRAAWAAGCRDVPPAEEGASQGDGGIAPPPPNGTLGHVIKRLMDEACPRPPGWQPAPVPAARIRAAVVGKGFSGKSTALNAFAAEHGAAVLSVPQLVREAVEASKAGEEAPAGEYGLDGVLPPATPEREPTHSERAFAEVLAGPDIVITQPPAASEAGMASCEGKEGADTTPAEMVQAADSPGDAATDATKISEGEGDAPAAVAGDAAPGSGHVQQETRDPAPARDEEETKETSTADGAAEGKSGVTASPRPSVRALLGQLALEAMLDGSAVPDRVAVALIAHAVRGLSDGRGWIIDGFPTTVQQAQMLSLALVGAPLPAAEHRLPTKDRVGYSLLQPPPAEEVPSAPRPSRPLDAVIICDVQDGEVLKRALDQRLDPATGKVYLMEPGSSTAMQQLPVPPAAVEPGMNEAEVVGLQSRLVPAVASGNGQAQLAHRLMAWNANLAPLADYYGAWGIVSEVDGCGSEQAVAARLTEMLIWVSQTEDREAAAAADAQRRAEEAARRAEEAAQEELDAQMAAEEAMANGMAEAEAAEAEAARRQAEEEEAANAAAKGRMSKGGSRPPSRKGSGKGKKGSVPAVPAAEELTAEMVAQEQTLLDKAAAEAEAARPKPGDPGYAYSQLPLERELALALAPLWNQAEETYIRTAKASFRGLREGQQAMLSYLFATREQFKEFVQRPDHKQEFVARWQRAFNDLADDMRGDAEAQAELHKRVADLEDTLFDICDTRKAEAGTERQAIMEERWLEDRLGVMCNLYLTLLQAECTRYDDTLAVLDDYYCNLKGAPLAEARSPTVVPLLDLSKPPDASLAAATGAKGKGKSKPPAAQEADGDAAAAAAARLAFVVGTVRPGTGDAADTQVWERAVAAAFAALVDRDDPEEARRAAADTKAAEAAAARAAAATPSKGKKGKKTVEPPPEPAPEPTAEEVERQARQEARQRLVDAADDEHYVAVRRENERFRARVELVRRTALGDLRALRAKGTATFAIMEEWLAARYKHECASVQALTAVLRRAIEAQARLPHELVLRGAEFVTEDSVLMYRPPSRPRPPDAVEGLRDASFTTRQLREAAVQFRSAAPAGTMPLVAFVEVLCNMAAAGRQVPAGTAPTGWGSWSRAGLEALSFRLCPASDFVDWRLFLVAAADTPLAPHADAVRAARHALQTACDGDGDGGVSAVRFAKVSLWFKTADPPRDEETWATEFPRGTALQNLLFDMFADDAAVYGGRRLAWRPLLLSACAHPVPLQGLRYAAEVVSAAPGSLTPEEVFVLLHHGRPSNADWETSLERIKATFDASGFVSGSASFDQLFVEPGAPKAFRALAPTLFRRPALHPSS